MYNTNVQLNAESGAVLCLFSQLPHDALCLIIETFHAKKGAYALCHAKRGLGW